MLRRYLWVVLALLMILSLAYLQGISPKQTLLSQCLDQITSGPPLCNYAYREWRWCCVPLPYQQWKFALCSVAVYYQPRPAPLPPSYYYTDRRYCSFSSTPCTPMVILRCPTP